MGWVYGVSITAALMAANYLIVGFFEQMQVDKGVVGIIQMLLIAITLFGSAYWIAKDSEKTEINKYEGTVQGSAKGLAIATVLLWPVVLPAYLQKRWMIKNKQAVLKPEYHPNYRKPTQ